MGSHRIKVAQQHNPPLRVGLGNVAEHLLYHTLCPAIWVGANALGTILCDWYLQRVSIDCSAAAEDNTFAAVFSHYIQQNKGAGDIVGIILQRFLYTLPNCL